MKDNDIPDMRNRWGMPSPCPAYHPEFRCDREEEHREAGWGPWAAFCRSDHLTVKFKWKCKWLKIAQVTLKQKSKVGVVVLPDFKTYDKVMVMKTVP